MNLPQKYIKNTACSITRIFFQNQSEYRLFINNLFYYSFNIFNSLHILNYFSVLSINTSVLLIIFLNQME